MTAQTDRTGAMADEAEAQALVNGANTTPAQANLQAGLDAAKVKVAGTNTAVERAQTRVDVGAEGLRNDSQALAQIQLAANTSDGSQGTGGTAAFSGGRTASNVSGAQAAAIAASVETMVSGVLNKSYAP